MNMDPRIQPESSHTLLVCHSSRAMVRIAQLNASRHGVRIVVAKNGADLMKKAVGQVRPDAIILSDDLKSPSTEELVKLLNQDPRLKGIPVVVLKGLIGNIGELLSTFKRAPWISKL